MFGLKFDTPLSSKNNKEKKKNKGNKNTQKPNEEPKNKDIIVKNSIQKIVVITGASSGIGKASALEILRQGDKVYALARSVDKMDDIEQLGGVPIQMDITKKEDIENAVNKIIKKEEKIDVLFNCAGTVFYAPIEETPIEKVRNLFEVNFFGLVQLTQLLIPHLRKNDSTGIIINTSALEGKIYSPLKGWYQASKHALEGWSDTLRLELMDFNINVIIIQPNYINTNFSSEILEDKEQAKTSSSTSKAGIYDKFYKVIDKEIKNYTNPRVIISPFKVAKLVANIINTTSHKQRYVIGSYGKRLFWLRKYLGDQFFDIYKMIRIDD